MEYTYIHAYMHTYIHTCIHAFACNARFVIDAVFMPTWKRYRETVQMMLLLNQHFNNASDCSRVKRGRDWAWADQDGGAGVLGTTVGAIDEEGWVQVAWESGVTNLYRWGADGKHDLALVSTYANFCVLGL